MAKPLNSSLTAMDWLPQLSVGGAMSDNPNAEIDASKYPSAQRVSCGQFDASAVFDASTCKFGNKKPPYSYANLITFAINATPKGKMTLSEIYDWISEHFPFYNPASNGWKVNIFFLHTKVIFNQRVNKSNVLFLIVLLIFALSNLWQISVSVKLCQFFLEK